MAVIGAVLAAFLGLIIAYLMVRKTFIGKKILDFIATLPYAVPGTMMGLGLVVAFNKAPIILTGTAVIIIMDYTIRRMPFGFRTGVATLQQIHISIEEASADLGAAAAMTSVLMLIEILFLFIFYKITGATMSIFKL
jgi:iron(III) transport system permease protein